MLYIIPRLLAPVFLALVLSACDVPDQRGVVQRLDAKTAEAVMSYSFNTCSATMSKAEQKRIYSFMSNLGLTKHDVVIISIPKGRIPSRDEERRRTLNGLMASHPAQVRYVQDKDFRQLPQSESHGVIRIVRATGVKVACPKGADVTAGCTSAKNLAAMIAQPGDLILPGNGRRYIPSVGGSQSSTGQPTSGLN